MSHEQSKAVGPGSGPSIEHDYGPPLPSGKSQYVPEWWGLPYHSEPREYAQGASSAYGRESKDTGEHAEMFNVSCLDDAVMALSPPGQHARPRSAIQESFLPSVNDNEWLSLFDTVPYDETRGTHRHEELGDLDSILEARRHFDIGHETSSLTAVNYSELFDDMGGKRKSTELPGSHKAPSSVWVKEDLEKGDSNVLSLEQYLHGSLGSERQGLTIPDRMFGRSPGGDASIESMRHTYPSKDREGMKLECPSCDTTFSGPYGQGSMHRHMRLIHGPRGKETVYRCEAMHCDKTFKRKDARLKHYRNKHPELGASIAVPRKNEVPIRHRRTSTTLSTESSLKSNASSIVLGSSYQEDWSLPKKLPIGRLTPQVAVKTISRSQTVMSDFEPGSIGASTPDQSAYDTEEGRSTGQEDERFECDTCDQSFGRLADLRRHVQKHQESKFVCDVTGCEKGFYRLDKLRDHVRTAHNGTLSVKEGGSLIIEVGEGEGKTFEKTPMFQCEHCSSTFEARGQLNKHMHRRHDRRYSCNSVGCTVTFALKTDLRRHVLAKHTAAVEMWHCTSPGCRKTFSRRDNLLRHQRHHEGAA